MQGTVMQETGDRTAMVLHVDSDDGSPLLPAGAPTPVPRFQDHRNFQGTQT